MARQRGFPSRSRRGTDWGVGPGGSGVTALVATGSTVLGAGITLTSLALTVVRTRGLFHCFLDGVLAADGDGFFGAVGIGLVSTAAFDAGITAVPTLVTEAVWDGWLWHSFFGVHSGDITFGPGGEA